MIYPLAKGFPWLDVGKKVQPWRIELRHICPFERAGRPPASVANKRTSASDAFRLTVLASVPNHHPPAQNPKADLLWLLDGRPLSKALAKPGADLVELLAYSGCRLAEATSIKWADVDFEKSAVKITGGDVGTKNHEHRTVPMTQALRALLERLRDERKPQPSDFVSQIDNAKKCLLTACRRLSYPNFTHHDFRHFFATTCIEAGVDIPTVSRWLGHKDGGALAMRVYGHLRDEHSRVVVAKVTF